MCLDKRSRGVGNLITTVGKSDGIGHWRTLAKLELFKTHGFALQSVAAGLGSGKKPT